MFRLSVCNFYFVFLSIHVLCQFCSVYAAIFVILSNSTPSLNLNSTPSLKFIRQERPLVNKKILCFLTNLDFGCYFINIVDQ